MATITENGQSYLELQAQDERNEETAKKDYNKLNYYDEKHPDALSTGDANGKGTGDFGGHGYSVPDLSKPKHQMNYGNFNTVAGGNNCDETARNTMMARSLYGSDRQYGIDVVPNTELNILDGQYDGQSRSRQTHICPVV